jgi:hypothetical protein
MQYEPDKQHLADWHLDATQETQFLDSFQRVCIQKDEKKKQIAAQRVASLSGLPPLPFLSLSLSVWVLNVQKQTQQNKNETQRNEVEYSFLSTSPCSLQAPRTPAVMKP